MTPILSTCIITLALTTCDLTNGSKYLAIRTDNVLSVYVDYQLIGRVENGVWYEK